jgi:hypothetical protein
MRDAVVESLVITALHTSLNDPPLPPESQLGLGKLGVFWLNSRSACAAICLALFIVFSVGITALMLFEARASAPTVPITFQAVVKLLAKTLLLGLVMPATCVFLPWALLRLRLRRRQIVMTRSLMKIFASHRPTRAEWAEASKIIRRAKPTILNYGIDEQLDSYCVE